MIRVLDLFSGIGGFSLGLERTGGFETVAFCEIEEQPQRILRKHWPGVPIYDDVRALTYERLEADGITVDVITAGFPCQDISTAGKMRGIHPGTRSGLWSEVARLTGELRPKYLLVENVAALLCNGLGRVLGDLAEIGYDAEWCCIPARAVGARHNRDRVWLVAYPQSEQRAPRVVRFDTRQLLLDAQGSSGLWAAEPDVGRVAHGIPRRVDRLKGLGNAVVPQIPELIGRAILAMHKEEHLSCEVNLP